MDILPELSELSLTNTLHISILPTPLYVEYGRTKACYSSSGHILKYILCKNELTKKIPLARKVLISHIGGNKDRWDILHEVFKVCLPYSGQMDFDAEATINTIISKDGMLLADHSARPNMCRHR